MGQVVKLSVKVHVRVVKLYVLYHVTDVDGMDDIQFSVNMTVDELNELLKLKGVDEEDCALFRSKCAFSSIW